MNSLRNRVIAIVTLASLLTVVAITITAYQSLGEDQRQLIMQREKLETERLTETVSRNIQQRVMALSAARSLLIRDGQLRAPEELESLIEEQAYLQRAFPGGIVVFDAQDTAIAESTHVPGRIGTNYADRDHFKRLHSTGKPVISEPIMGRTTELPLLSFLVPIRHEGQMVASIGGIIKLGDECILPAQAEHGDAPGSTLSLIIDRQHQLFIEAPGSEAGDKLQPLPSSGEDPLVDAILEKDNQTHVIDYRGQQYLLATDTVDRLNWVFARAAPYDQAMSPLMASLHHFLVLSAGVTLVLLVIAWLAARSLTRPLTKATRTINAMAEAPESSKALPEKGPQEIRELSIAFNGLSRERQQLDELKNDFISSVSHELRTPLTSIEGSLKMMVAGVSGELPEKAHSMACIALRNSEQLNGLIRDLLDFNKLLAGKREFRIEHCCVDECVQNAIEGNQTMARMYHTNLNPSDSTGLGVDADPQALRQVLDNLISNAIKHSPRCGEIQVDTRQQARDRVCITVSNQGDGVPDWFQDHVFERFSQAEGGATRATAGTGLGLAISQELIQGMGGDIGFYNEQGAHFWITLPLSSLKGAQ